MKGKIDMRLTKSIKESIINRILKDTFEARETELLAAEFVLGDKIWEDTHPAEVRETMDLLPHGYLGTASSISASFEGERYTRVQLKESRRMKFALAAHHYAACSYEKGHPIHQAYLEHLGLKRQLDKDAKALKDRLAGLFEVVTTSKRALEVWPECAPYLPEETPPPPAPIVGDLNEVIARLKGEEVQS